MLEEYTVIWRAFQSVATFGVTSAHQGKLYVWATNFFDAAQNVGRELKRDYPKHTIVIDRVQVKTRGHVFGVESEMLGQYARW